MIKVGDVLTARVSDESLEIGEYYLVVDKDYYLLGYIDADRNADVDLEYTVQKIGSKMGRIEHDKLCYTRNEMDEKFNIKQLKRKRKIKSFLNE